MALLVPGSDAIHNSVINSDKFSWSPATAHESSDDVKHSYQSSPLSPGAHALTVPHGLAHIEQRYHVAGSGPVCIAHSGGPRIGWEYLRIPELEEPRLLERPGPLAGFRRLRPVRLRPASSRCHGSQAGHCVYVSSGSTDSVRLVSIPVAVATTRRTSIGPRTRSQGTRNSAGASAYKRGRITRSSPLTSVTRTSPPVLPATCAALTAPTALHTPANLRR